MNRQTIFIASLALALISFVSGVYFKVAQNHTKHMLALIALAIIFIVVALVNRPKKA